MQAITLAANDVKKNSKSDFLFQNLSLKSILFYLTLGLRPQAFSMD